VTTETERLKRELADALAVVYHSAAKCDVCREYVATRAGYDDIRGWIVCDRADCGEPIECVASNTPHDPPQGHRAASCAWCGSTRRVPRSPSWQELPHAATLRAANAAHGAP
jgi:hypothetical protein